MSGRSHPAPLARLALGMAAFGSATPVSKLVARVLPVYPAAALRVALGALTLLPFALRNAADVRRITVRDWVLLGLIALFGMFGFTALMLHGMQLTSGVVGASVMSTAPAVTAAASMLFLGDRATWRKLAAVGLAVAGVLALHAGRGGEGGSEAPLLGSALVFAAVCCETVYTLVGKRLSERIDPVLTAFLAALLAVPLFVPFALWQWDQVDLAGVSAAGWLALAWYGAGTLALGTWLWYSGIARAEGSIAAGFMGVMPASALVLSYALLDEPFRWRHLFGFAVVFAGVLLVSWEHGRSED